MKLEVRMGAPRAITIEQNPVAGAACALIGTVSLLWRLWFNGLSGSPLKLT